MRHGRRSRRRRRRSRAGAAGLATAILLALLMAGSLASMRLSSSHHRAGPASMVCTLFPLSYVAIVCGIIGVIPRGQNTLHGWCALAISAASWIGYAVCLGLASH